MSDISPEIAALLADTEFSDEEDLDIEEFLRNEQNADFGDFKKTDSAPKKEAPSVDLTKTTFAPVTKFFNDQPSKIYSDPAYYKTSLSNETETANRLHAMLTKYLTCQDPKDKTVFRQQIVPIYWEFLKSVAQKMTKVETPMCKRMMTRYSIVLPSLFSPEQKEMFSKAIFENTSDEPIYYLDEWFKGIASGVISLSATDEARPRAKSGAAGSTEEARRLLQLKTKNSGKLQNAETMLMAKENERRNIENALRQHVEDFCTHDIDPGKNGHKKPLSESQKRLGTDISEKVKLLLKIDKEIIQYSKDYNEAFEASKNLESKLENASVITEVNTADFFTEFDTVRQMAKMTVGRMGNHFPIFTREFFHCTPKGTGFRENVIRELTWVESLDPGVFCRVHKNVMNRIVPYVILVPTYGDTGFCWEPFDRYNRVTSRGRIVIPMYPKSLQIAILIACADLRWQVAKEKASYYWMEEGLTGHYYQWFESQKLKGDVKEFFINDYILWMTKESEGVQRLEKEVRGIFWRHIPFPQERKELLKTRSIAYQELFQRDINRSMSDGY